MPTVQSSCTTPLSRPTVGVSSCLVGQAVRYDSSDKCQPLLLNCLQPHVDWLPFCPEVAANLGVPRPPIRLLRDQRGVVRALGVEDDALDVTNDLARTSEQKVVELVRLPALCGYIVKARSPSCGLGSTPLTDNTGRSLAPTHGLFTAALKRLLPELILVDEVALADRTACWRFLSACYLVFHYRFRLVPYPALSDLLPQPQNEVELRDAVRGLLRGKAENKKAVPTARLEQLFDFWRAVTPPVDAS